MNMLRVACCVLGSALVLSGCKADDPPTTWEIVHGTATLAAAKAIAESSFTEIVALSGRSGSLTVADDTTLSGWYRLSPADSQHHFTGTLTLGPDPIMALSGVTPWQYHLLTNPDFADTYALVSDTVLTANLVGDATLERYRLYWEFHK
jgi:hypothetical protein